jgi:hypothetical protein
MKKKMVRRFTLSIGVLSVVKALQHHSHYPGLQPLNLFGFLMYPFRSEGGTGSMFSRSA